MQAKKMSEDYSGTSARSSKNFGDCETRQFNCSTKSKNCADNEMRLFNYSAKSKNLADSAETRQLVQNEHFNRSSTKSLQPLIDGHVITSDDSGAISEYHQHQRHQQLTDCLDSDLYGQKSSTSQPPPSSSSSSGQLKGSEGQAIDFISSGTPTCVPSTRHNSATPANHTNYGGNSDGNCDRNCRDGSSDDVIEDDASASGLKWWRTGESYVPDHRAECQDYLPLTNFKLSASTGV